MAKYRITLTSQEFVTEVEAPTEEEAIKIAENQAYDYYTSSSSEVIVTVKSVEQIP